MAMKAQAGLLPEMNAIEMLSQVSADYFNTEATAGIGWGWHFFIGAVVWGLVFASLESIWPGKSDFSKGLSFSVLAWLVMMVAFMPLANAGFFANAIGPMAAIATLVLHLIYGAILGTTFAFLQKRGPLENVNRPYASYSSRA